MTAERTEVASSKSRPTGDGEHEPDEGHEHFEGAWWQFPPMRNALIAGAVLAVGFLTDVIADAPSGVIVGLYVTAALVGAFHWGQEALEALRELTVNIDVLMAVAAVGAAALGLWEEAAFLTFLYGAAEALEELTYDRTRRAICSLLNLVPPEAHLMRDGEEMRVAAAELKPGDVFRVRPGENLPTDGQIRSGSSSLNEAAITGESIPVEKGPGDEVFAGSLNGTGSIDVVATRSFEDNTVSRIIRLVEEAQEQKTNAQRFIDRFGARYSPAVLVGVVLLLTVPVLLGGDFRDWATRAVTLAVAAAPCALVMSTPVAVAAAIGTAGQHGVLIKGGLHLETLGLLKAIALDKTGTLTRNHPQVTDTIPLGGLTAEDVLGPAVAVEAFSEHPLAKAIVEAARASSVPIEPAENFRALTGAGASASVNGSNVLVGSLDLFQAQGVRLSDVEAQAEALRQQGKTTVLVGSGERLLGLIAIRDELRPEAAEAIRALHAAGVRRVVMLTGDNERTALALARQVGIDEVRAGLKPEDKTTAIEEITATSGVTGMVGDGVNDAPALAAASVGIAMGTAGTDAAIEAADVALMGDDLMGLVYAVRLGRRAQFISRQNIVFSLLLLAVLIPSAVLGIVSVAVAVIAHEVSELIAVANGLRARL